MIREIARPTISPAFTISDIHKIRKWHYEMLKDATVQEQLDFYNKEESFQRRNAAITHGGQIMTEEGSQA
jgi:hypothetical protein